ncbi:NADPH-dependent FMN reductase [Alicyclobacillus suci]|uniref:NADPH-dependent FMN reductase n=1 Tax=Alicyclobacillus suci TaxID=2816080 RepID=UPI001A90C20A|nr:NADPH-dependent FMN reductase [Alicyclobacillus suci]
MAKITIISGSPSKNSRTEKFIRYLETKLQANHVQINRIFVRDFSSDDLVYANFESDAIRDSIQQIEESDAVVVATPVYKAAYTGLLKIYLDMLPQGIFTSKIMYPLVVGGSPAHLLVIDYALKPILCALGARTILPGIYCLDNQVSEDGQGGISVQGDLKKRFDSSMEELLNRMLPNQTNEQLYVGGNRS